jgi:lipocalin
MEESSKRKRFTKVATNRVQKIINYLDLLQNCSNRNNYEYDEEDVNHMFDEINKAIRDTKAVYTNELNKTTGKGKYPKPESYPGRLKVSFFLWFYSDYYILELDEQAYTYAVVGSSSNKYLWILYREPVMPQLLLTELIKRLKKRGYDTSKLLFVDQAK